MHCYVDASGLRPSRSPLLTRRLPQDASGLCPSRSRLGGLAAPQTPCN